MRIPRASSAFGASLLAVLLSGCASQEPTVPAAGASDARSVDLACTFAGNCVNSLTSGLVPLRYAGTPAQALATLQATLGTFAEAQVVRSEPLALEVIFTTPAGFKDQVDFMIDAEAQRIDFRSRSLFGLFDWGKNRSRIQEFASRFDQQTRR
jgi:uncharacterized protein (DUF1499 family)